MTLGTLSLDIRYAVRRLLRSPAFTLGAVALLAVGIGANITAFTVVDALLFRPPPWNHPEEVVHVYQDSDDGEPSSSSYPATRDMAASDVFAAVTAMTPASAAWERRGQASGKSISTRAIAYILVGHVTHHLGVLRERYRVSPSPDVVAAV